MESFIGVYPTEIREEYSSYFSCHTHFPQVSTVPNEKNMLYVGKETSGIKLQGVSNNHTTQGGLNIKIYMLYT